MLIKRENIPPSSVDPGSGFGSGTGLEPEKNEGIPLAHKRTDIPQEAKQKVEKIRFDKMKRPLISKGFWVRKDLDMKYEVKGAILREKKQELFNAALEYYYDNVLNKPHSEKLKESGQEPLDI